MRAVAAIALLLAGTYYALAYITPKRSKPLEALDIAANLVIVAALTWAAL